ncbi:hypothetical protein [Pseudomonas sp. GOM6]|uniref:hypothetical protein n=1 Tax=Pseudomonas sp. GOM6 TaxID=3036944 RepID=UPI00240A01C9|nr:hypothetical protein [Pseudomonas sp. GOM6]MDG1580995.1 hypothetical protein [Pseudomonas sp. GOM6]
MMMDMQCSHADKAVGFLREIGLSVDIVPGATGFIEHIAIVEGGLQVDPRAPASGLLHEAGHLATIPTRFRGYMSGSLGAGMKRAFEELDQMGLEPDDPLARAMVQCSDPEATAWAWAAGKALDIPDEKIVQDHEYEGTGAWIRKCLAARSYLGINGMSHAGFCVLRATPYRPLPVYPELAFWLQP